MNMDGYRNGTKPPSKHFGGVLSQSSIFNLQSHKQAVRLPVVSWQKDVLNSVHLLRRGVLYFNVKCWAVPCFRMDFFLEAYNSLLISK